MSIVNNCKEHIIKITELVTQINVETDYAVFMSISGHVGWLNFRIVKSKDKYNDEVYRSKDLHYMWTGKVRSEEYMKECLEEWEEELIEVIKKLKRFL